MSGQESEVTGEEVRGHSRVHEPRNGPDWCRECSDDVQAYVKWPCKVGALEALVRNLVQSETCDYPHRQWIYRSGPQDWDAEPMSEAEYDLIQTVVFGRDGRQS